MQRFHFRYATLLKQAERHEQQRQRELAERLRTRIILETQLRDMQTTIQTAKHELGEGLVGKVDLAAIGAVARYAGDSTLRGRAIVQRLARLDGQIDRARSDLADATRKRRSLELLHDRDHEAWKKERRRKETLELDEVASRRHHAQTTRVTQATKVMEEVA